jgi:parallel beta-helix repeat protein
MITLSPCGADDTLQIQAAIDSLPNGGLIHLEAGQFNCGKVPLRNKITIQGEGDATVIRLKDSTNKELFSKTNGGTGIHIRNLCIDGNRQNNTVGHPIEFKDVVDSSITNCKIYNSSQNGIRWDGCTGNLIAFNQIYDNAFCGIRCGETGTSLHSRIIGNYTLNNLVIGISVDSVSRFVLNSNVSNNNGDNGIDLCASNECVVMGNECLSNANQGIAFDGWTYPNKTVNDNIAIGNVCAYNGQYGFDTANVNSGMLISNNVLKYNTLGAVRDTGTGTGKKINHNQGFRTESSGTVQIPAGSTFVVVNHSLNINVGERNIALTPSNSLGMATKYWISDVGITSFRINVNTDPLSGGAWFNWQACRVS